MEESSRGRGKNKRFWTYDEDSDLIKFLHELSCDPKWKGEGGFKNGYMNKLEELINDKRPNCGLKAVPHIESRIKYWSEKYSALAEMLSTSGFGWDAEKKMLQVDKGVYDAWVKVHKKAKGLYGVPFNHYDKLEEIFAKDKATGDVSESFVGAINNINDEISKKPMNIESDEEDDADSKTQSSMKSTQSEKRHIKQENDSASSRKRKFKELKGKGTDVDNLVSSFHDATTTFGKIFENVNLNLATMANSWAKAEEREQKLDEKVNQVLEEVLKLEGISPSEALEAATILMAEEHKLRIFYQAPSNLKKQYVLDLLKKNRP